MSEKQLICASCQCPLVKKRVDFAYVGHTFFADALRCPSCGQVYLPEELILGRVAEVEKELEDK